MKRMTGIEIRDSIVNGSNTETLNMVLPSNFVDLDWQNLDYLGWRDSHSPHLGYIIRWQDDRAVGIIVREVWQAGGIVPYFRAHGRFPGQPVVASR